MYVNNYDNYTGFRDEEKHGMPTIHGNSLLRGRILSHTNLVRLITIA